MELNGFNSNNYIYLKLNNKVKIDGVKYDKNEIMRFTRSDIEKKVISRLMYQGIDDNLTYVPKPEDQITDKDILPNQLNERIYFKEDTRAHLILWPHEIYCFSDWMKDHLTNSDAIETDFLHGRSESRMEYNMRNITEGCKKTLPNKKRPPMIEVGDHNVELIFTFKKGEELDFNDPGVMTLLLARDMAKLLLNSSIIEGEEKDKLFTEDFQNAFFDSEFYNRKERDRQYHYYHINDDINVRSKFDLPYYHSDGEITDENGFVRYIYLEAYDYSDFSRYAEAAIKKFASEVSVADARVLHARLLYEKHCRTQKMLEDFRREEDKKERKLEAKFAKKKGDATIFPGTNGKFVQIYNRDNTSSSKKKTQYSLDDIKEFYERLKDINRSVLDYMYFYGGTIPYMLTNATSSRNFGDVDIFVPIEAMQSVRAELSKQPSFEMLFDSQSITSSCNFTSRLPKNELSTKENEENDAFNLLMALASDDNVVDSNGKNSLENYIDGLHGNRVYQDFGFKANLFGVNISIFPLYQYKKDLMAKSFNITDVYNYLLAVRVMNNMELKDFAKNVKINGQNINILPPEYILISKESAIKDNYVKRLEKDQNDVDYINEHRKELGISDELIAKLKGNYPNYSIALAYYIMDSGIERISGEKYKELMLLNKGEWLT